MTREKIVYQVKFKDGRTYEGLMSDLSKQLNYEICTLRDYIKRPREFAVKPLYILEKAYNVYDLDTDELLYENLTFDEFCKLFKFKTLYAARKFPQTDIHKRRNCRTEVVKRAKEI